MDKQAFTIDFIKSYRELLLTCSHDQIKAFNNKLKKYNYFLVYPFTDSDKDQEKIALLTGFADTFEVHQKDDKATMPAAMQQITAGQGYLTIGKDLEITETVGIPTSEIEPIAVRKVEWSELINAPKLNDADFDLLQDSFLEYFNLDEYSYQAGSNESFRFGDYFREESNKPEGLELREVWHDTCDDDKHGTVQTLVFWKDEFIGWIGCSGRYLTSSSASTVNLPKWTELMDTLYANSGYNPGRNVKGVSVYDMTKDDVDDVTYVPGVSTLNHDYE